MTVEEILTNLFSKEADIIGTVDLNRTLDALLIEDIFESSAEDFFEAMHERLIPEEFKASLFKANLAGIYRHYELTITGIRIPYIFSAAIIACAINWKKLFMLCYNELNWRMYDRFNEHFTKAEFKDCVRFLINFLSTKSWFIDLYNNTLLKYKLD